MWVYVFVWGAKMKILVSFLLLSAYFSEMYCYSLSFHLAKAPGPGGHHRRSLHICKSFGRRIHLRYPQLCGYKGQAPSAPRFLRVLVDRIQATHGMQP